MLKLPSSFMYFLKNLFLEQRKHYSERAFWFIFLFEVLVPSISLHTLSAPFHCVLDVLYYLFAGLTYLPTLAILLFISVFEIWGYALLDNCIIHVDMSVSDGFSEEIKTIGTCQCYCIITYLPLSPYLYSINILL